MPTPTELIWHPGTETPAEISDTTRYIIYYRYLSKKGFVIEGNIACWRIFWYSTAYWHTIEFYNSKAVFASDVICWTEFPARPKEFPTYQEDMAKKVKPVDDPAGYRIEYWAEKENFRYETTYYPSEYGPFIQSLDEAETAMLKLAENHSNVNIELRTSDKRTVPGHEFWTRLNPWTPRP